MLHSNIIQLRLARILLGVIAGAGLSVAGVIFQSLLRNPLAEPYVLGVSSGSGLGAALAILLGLNAARRLDAARHGLRRRLGHDPAGLRLGRNGRGGHSRPHAACSPARSSTRSWRSLLMFLVSVAPSRRLAQRRVVAAGQPASLRLAIAARRRRRWSRRGWSSASLLARDLNLMTLGEEAAAHLGLHVEQTKKLFFVVASLMTGATVAACGLIGFVGLIVPHTVRLVVGPDHRRLVPASALAGAAFLVLADSFARIVIAPTEIPIGVITAFLGGPFFLFLLRRKKSFLRS